MIFLILGGRLKGEDDLSRSLGDGFFGIGYFPGVLILSHLKDEPSIENSKQNNVDQQYRDSSSLNQYANNHDNDFQSKNIIDVITNYHINNNENYKNGEEFNKNRFN